MSMRDLSLAELNELRVEGELLRLDELFDGDKKSYKRQQFTLHDMEIAMELKKSNWFQNGTSLERKI